MFFIFSKNYFKNQNKLYSFFQKTSLIRLYTINYNITIINKKYWNYINYSNVFFFFFPSPTTVHTNINTYSYEAFIDTYKMLRFKPRYQDIFRYYRKFWLKLKLNRKLKQHRTTRVIYNYAFGNYYAHNIYNILSNKNTFYVEPTKQFLNWKYIV